MAAASWPHPSDRRDRRCGRWSGKSCIPTLNQTLADLRIRKRQFLTFGIFEIAPVRTNIERNYKRSKQGSRVCCFPRGGHWRLISLTRVALDVMSSTDRIFCGRSRTELGDERALACRFPTGIPYVRVALFLFEWRWSHNFVNRGCGERRAALPKTQA